MASTRSRSAKPNCPGAPGRRAGSRGNSGAAARSAVVMNGFSAAARHARKRNAAPSRAARRRFAKAATGSSKNITPRRETMVSNPAGAKAWVCASAHTKRACEPARSARARAASIIGAEMSMPTHSPASPDGLASASVTAPVPQPTSSTRPRGRPATASVSSVPSGANSRSSSGCRSTQARPAGPFHSRDCSLPDSCVWCIFLSFLACLRKAENALCKFKSA